MMQPELEDRPQSRREWSGWFRSLVLPLAIVVAIVGGLLVYESRGEEEADSPYGTVALAAAKNPTGRPPAAEAGRAAPDFLLNTLEGTDLHLSDLQGRPLLVNFWATWCTSCRQEMPDFVAVQEEHRDRGFLIIAVNLRESEERARGFVEEFGL